MATVQQSSDNNIDIDNVETRYKDLVTKFMPGNEDIIKRLAGLFTAWRQGNFNETIQSSLVSIETSLASVDVTAAEKVFEVVSADWSSVIGPNNMLIIKKLINAARNTLDKEQTQEGAISKPL